MFVCLLCNILTFLECVGVVLLSQVSECRDACSDACLVVREVGSGHTTCCAECSVDSHPVLPRVHAARRAGIPVVSI